MNNKNIIIITGELAAGKTSYGKKISEVLKMPFYIMFCLEKKLLN